MTSAMNGSGRTMFLFWALWFLPGCLLLADLSVEPPDGGFTGSDGDVEAPEDSGDDGSRDALSDGGSEDIAPDAVVDGSDDVADAGLVAANACGGTGSLTWDGESAAPGEPCGAFEEGTLVCNGLDALRCVGVAAPNACGGTGVLAAEPGAACGCGGRVACTADGAVECAAGGQTNACGGCDWLPQGRPGFACTQGSETGRFVCVSRELIECVPGAVNACGGQDELSAEGIEAGEAAPGLPCESSTCGPGVLVCDGSELLECQPTGPCNACDGRTTLAGEPDAPCGTCGEGSWVCDGADRVVCENVAPVNACGGCESRSAAPGTECTEAEGGAEGTVQCRGDEAVCVTADTGGRNACGGIVALSTAAGVEVVGATLPGAACGGCGEGVLFCEDESTLACSEPGSGTLNSCGGCARLSGVAGTPCGTCGSGALVCDGEESIVCEGDLGTSRGRNACGGCGELPTNIGESCGTCLAWGCEGSALVCRPTTTPAGCEELVTCAELSCDTQNRSCVESDGEVQARCGECLNGFTQSGGTQCVAVDCGGLISPANGSVATPSGTTAGAQASYSCRTGYRLIGDQNRTCQASGLWSGGEPLCTLVECETLASPANGSVRSPDGSTVGATATYSCLSGFVLAGSASRTCLADGSWSGAPPTCAAVDCGTLASLPNGSVSTPGGTTRGAVANYACDQGYVLTGSATRQCEDAGTWSGSAPQCTAVDCGTLDAPANGSVAVPTGTRFGARATYGCATGYQVSGNVERLCQANGVWSGSAATCVVLDCGVPPAVVNGSLTFGVTTFGATAGYTCNSGFNRIGSASVTCSATGAWTAPPTCSDINECELSTPCPGDGQRCENTPGTWRCVCTEGYTGSTVTGAPAACTIVDCGTPPTVASSTRSFTTTTWQSTAEYTCANGYNRTGASTIRCLSTGAWEPAPSCNDVDECATGDACSGFANTCSNRPGSWDCGCAAGYAGTLTSGGNATCRGEAGAACEVDVHCQTGLWCPTSTTPELRRCSPRLFAGQAQQMDYVLVPGGEFTQGNAAEGERERPYVSRLTRDYWMSRTEVTQAQWRAATGTTNPSCYQNTTGTACGGNNGNNAAPVESVDWFSALAYANWLSAQNGLSACYVLTGCDNATTGWYDGAHTGCSAATFTGPGCTGYRLPTEAEWERAARAGTTGTFYWGSSTSAGTVGLYAWYGTNSAGRTQEVRGKLPNAWGLFDMSGNVSEWVWDWVFVGDGTTLWAPYPLEPTFNYLGAPTGLLRGVRGGAFDATDTRTLRSSDRQGYSPASRFAAHGFRLVRSFPVVDCGALVSPALGTVETPAGTTVNQEATYRCDVGVTLVGESRRVCQADGNWSGTAPQCVPSLGLACTSDEQCSPGEWCPTNTLTALRRCSPRLEYGASRTLDFALVPAGTFQQGTPGATNQERPYQAQITSDYWVSTTEVTQQQWQEVISAWQSRPDWARLTGWTSVFPAFGATPSCWQSADSADCSDGNVAPDAPVERVSFWDAVVFANALSVLEGLAPCYTLSVCQTETTGVSGMGSGCADDEFNCSNFAFFCNSVTFPDRECTGYRLLTESEWERAARGGTSGTTYWWGNDASPEVVETHAWFNANSGQRSHPVAQKLPNPYGLYDMTGNVSELVWDWVFRFADGFIPYPVDLTPDYLGPSSGFSRGVRGGSVYDAPAQLRHAGRADALDTQRGTYFGIRLARTVILASP